MLALVLATILTVGCPPKCRDYYPFYYPLAVNNTWEYTMGTVTTIRGSQDTTFTRTDSSQTTVIAETTYFGDSVWKLRSQSTSTTDTAYTYIGQENGEIRDYPPPDLCGATVRTILQLPLAENATWTVQLSEYGGVVKERATVEAHGPLTVPAGTFSDAWEVDYVQLYSQPIETTQTWYVDGIGVAKSRTSRTTVFGSDTTTEVTTTSLTNYTVR